MSSQRQLRHDGVNIFYTYIQRMFIECHTIVGASRCHLESLLPTQDVEVLISYIEKLLPVLVSNRHVIVKIELKRIHSVVGKVSGVALAAHPWKLQGVKMADWKDSLRNTPWVDEEGQLFEYSAQSPAPSKNFNQIIVSPTHVSYTLMMHALGL